MKPLHSIRARMTFAFSLLLTLFLTLACAGLILFAHRDAAHLAKRTLEGAAEKVEGELTLAAKANRGHAPLSEIQEEERDLAGENLTLTIVGAGGRVLRQSQTQVPPYPLPPHSGWFVKTLKVGEESLIVGLPWWKTERALHRQAAFLVLLSALGCVCASAGAWVLVGRTLSPIRQLTQGALKASVDSPEVRLEAPSEDAEIVGLVNTLNDLLERLQRTTAARGRFYAAASHELRTPLQALSGHLELALTRPREADEYRAVVEEAHRQSGRLTSLVRDLLLLNQLESGSVPPSEWVSLKETCSRSLKLFALLIESRGLHCTSALADSILVFAPSTHVEMLVRNLTENAAKYAEKGGELRLGITVSSEAVRLEIFNSCRSGLLPWEGEKLFEPFYRPDASRNSETGGNGMGLAICKAISEANGWTLALNRTPEGVQATVEMPS